MSDTRMIPWILIATAGCSPSPTAKQPAATAIATARAQPAPAPTSAPSNEAALPAALQESGKKCSDGDGSACVQVALALEGSKKEDFPDLKRAPMRALRYMEKACAITPATCTMVAFRRVNDANAKYFPVGPKHAFPFFDKGCKGGDIQACDETARMISTPGNGVPNDPARAAKLARKVCDSLDMACDLLARLYRDGVGVKADERRAKELYQKACDGGSSESCEEAKKLKP